MLILLEGPDGAGKSTLARLIAEEHGADIVHCGPDLGLGFEELTSKYLELLMTAHYRDVVIDRLWVSECIYGKVVRDNNVRITDIGLKALAFIFKELNGVMVYCLPPYEVCLANYLANKPAEYVQDTTLFTRIYLEYFKASVKPYLYLPGRQNYYQSVKHYDYTKDVSWVQSKGYLL